MRLLSSFLAGALALVCAKDALAYCRTGTCALPANFLPSEGACVPPGFTSCDIGGATVRNIPLWWKNACVGYSMQKDASSGVTLAQATQAMAQAFGAWAGASCPGAPSILPKDLGPVACSEAAFHIDGGNQHLIVFRDHAWPHKAANDPYPSATIALTTVSFNRDTGEILDADIELNTADHRIVPAAVTGAGVYSLESVLAHEAGHFLGLAHSPNRNAVMYYEDEGGSSQHHSLSPDDASGICAVYPPSGKRPVDTQVSASGEVAATECDPTPRGGLAYQCAVSSTHTVGAACASASTTASGEGSGAPFAVLGALFFVTWRRRSVYRREARAPLCRGRAPRRCEPSS